MLTIVMRTLSTLHSSRRGDIGEDGVGRNWGWIVTHHQHTSSTGRHSPEEQRDFLKDEDRHRRLPPDPILEAVGIQAGATVIDVGAGTGFWTVPLSRRVGTSGKVLAIDVEPIMIKELSELVKAQGIGNVSVVKSEDLSIPLADHIADAALVGFVLHHASEPKGFLHEVTRLLRSDGRVVVVEWHKRATEHGPPVELRLSEEETRSLLEKEGYAVDQVPAGHDDVYVLLGRRG